MPPHLTAWVVHQLLPLVVSLASTGDQDQLVPESYPLLPPTLAQPLCQSPPPTVRSTPVPPLMLVLLVLADGVITKTGEMNPTLPQVSTPLLAQTLLSTPPPVPVLQRSPTVYKWFAEIMLPQVRLTTPNVLLARRATGVPLTPPPHCTVPVPTPVPIQSPTVTIITQNPQLPTDVISARVTMLSSIQIPHVMLTPLTRIVELSNLTTPTV